MISRSRLLDRSQSRVGHELLGWRLRHLSPDSIARVSRQVERTALPVDAESKFFHHPLTTKAELADLLLVISALCQQALGMRPYWTQLVGGVGVAQGRVLEMATGEGKTLTALVGALMGLSQGWPVHIVTANDYLAQRDWQESQGLWDLLGLTSSVLQPGDEGHDRAKAFSAQVLYSTGKELVFEALRDRLALDDRQDSVRHGALRLSGSELPRPFVRGLGLVIIDECDSVLIDEASTPCVISGSGGRVWRLEDLQESLTLANQLVEGQDFYLESRKVNVTESGHYRIDKAVCSEALANRLYRTSLVNLALSALHQFERDKDYVLDQQKVVIVDALTGRLMPDRRWEQGLHEMIEVKEGLAPSAGQRTLGKLTYPQFFAQYACISGMSGTVSEVARELKQSYGLRMMKVPALRPSRRVFGGIDWWPSNGEKFQALVAKVQALVDDNRAVLVGVPNIEQCDLVSAKLQAEGVQHQVLDGRQDSEEAERVAQAGRAGQVTVATAVAGRGTDIKLSEVAKLAGGLHVILTEFQFSARIDRQLIGRAARQGDPGSYSIMVSAEDKLMRENRSGQGWGAVAPSLWWLRQSMRRLQQRNEKKAMQLRSKLREQEEKRGEWLPFLKQP